MTNERSKNQIAATAGVLFFLLIAAFFRVHAEMPPWAASVSQSAVVLFAVPAFWATRRWLGWRDAIAMWVILGFAALAIETVAIITGFPYGQFVYSDAIGSKLLGLTPWTIIFAWTPLVLAAYFLAAALVGRQRPVVSFKLSALRVLIAAVMLVLFDLVLDPGAVGLGLWQYKNGGAFCGVPLSNFFGWLGSGAFGTLLIDTFARRRSPLLPVPAQLASSTFFIVAFWTFVSGFLMMFWPASIGLVILATLAVFWFKFKYEFDDMIVFCNEDATPTGTAPKLESHDGSTRRHLAFSVFVFNGKGDLLLQQRAESKKTWPGVWSNSCCGHVMLHENITASAKRRLRFELGLAVNDLRLMLPDFRYRAEKDGVVENEICPVFVGFADVVPSPNLDEVQDIRWVNWNRFVDEVADPANGYSPWAREEVELLARDPGFRELYSRIAGNGEISHRSGRFGRHRGLQGGRGNAPLAKVGLRSVSSDDAACD